MDKETKKKKAKKKLTDHGNNGRNGKRSEKKAKTVKVYLPAIIPGRGPNEPEPEPCEHELSYKDALLAVEMEKLAAKGLTNDQIINALGISRTTFYKRLKEDNYFMYCLNKHRGKAVMDVESALYKNATGFEYIEQVATPAGKVVAVLKQKTPETKAIEFFLMNRAPDQWKKKIETTIQAGETIEKMAAFVIKRREE